MYDQREVAMEHELACRTGPAPDRPIIDENQTAPHILRNGVVTPAEVEKLFQM